MTELILFQQPAQSGVMEAVAERTMLSFSCLFAL